METQDISCGVRPHLTDVIPFGGLTDAALVSAVATIEFLSEHRIARAIVQYAYDRGLPIGEPEQFQHDPNRGVRGVIGGRTWLVGNRDWLREHEVDPSEAADAIAASAETAGKIVCFAARDGEVLGVLALSGWTGHTQRR